MIRQRLRAWLNRRVRPEAGPVELTGRRIYIMPDRNGVLFGGVFGIMLLGAMNENLNLGFAIAALLSGILFVSILHTYRNLKGLRISIGQAEPVFAGESASFPVLLTDAEGIARHAIGLQGGVGHDLAEPGDVLTDIPAGGASNLALTEKARRRGWLAAGRFTLYTRYPLGLIQAWSHQELEALCLVYPRPEPGLVPLPDYQRNPEAGDGMGGEGDDFIGLRDS